MREYIKSAATIPSRTTHRFLRTFGIDYVPFKPSTHHLARRKRLLELYGIDLVLDVGANSGQFSHALRDLGYRGKIISFEPLSSAYRELARVARNDPNWQTFPDALGATPATTTFHIAGNSQSSSLLDMLPAHLAADPTSRGTGQQTVNIKTLDSLFDSMRGSAQNIYLKLDTQGFELEILKGAIHSLTAISTIQLEMSTIPLYDGAPLYQDCLDFLTACGYRLVALDSAWTNPETGEMLQMDGTFHRYE